jgi:hypothetical protein
MYIAIFAGYPVITKMIRLVSFLVAVALTALPAANAEENLMSNATEVSRFAGLALDCVHREYPNKISHVLQSDADARPPRALTPVFYGCYDWHSAVHAHWMLARLAGLYPDAEFAAAARAALAASFTAQKVEGELAYFAGADRAGFERPYGLAWFLQLMAELRQWDDVQAQQWAAVLAPLEDVIEARLLSWLPNLVYPVRSGTHNQTAFSFALALDWARIAGRQELADKLVTRSRQFYAGDRACPLAYEPSGEDFLSPCLMQADLMRRVIPAAEYPDWLAAFLPGIPEDGSAGWIEPGTVVDPTDGKLVHLDGFNLSRAWNLEGIAAGLAVDDRRRTSLLAAAAQHRATGLAAVTDEHYAGGHWLASFATYLVSGKALEARAPGDDDVRSGGL